MNRIAHVLALVISLLVCLDAYSTWLCLHHYPVAVYEGNKLVSLAIEYMGLVPGLLLWNVLAVVSMLVFHLYVVRRNSEAKILLFIYPPIILLRIWAVSNNLMIYWHLASYP